MSDLSEFEDIRPYSDAEALEALDRIARNPRIYALSQYLFPNYAIDFLSDQIRKARSIDEFQNVVVIGALTAIMGKTSEGFTFSGEENLKAMAGKKFLAISNHRDIILDPALIMYALHAVGLPYAEVCVGSNLLSNTLVEDLLRSNRMIKVIRGITARELYLSSRLLSKYIRTAITSGRSSVWVAQREGRTKNGLDITEQGLLKMFDMSGEGSFEENFRELNILPMSISYEYEPCDSR
ncbi:MAG: 1-acyl-sn-glycerol-3-phosphate acyltransferase [Bacteroidales bacterium]|nr:1-acyl-sn-glycerol-3-phosphate acyltransferase [Bacteroidales bacterium]